MINSLSLQNFQSHKKTNLEFSDGVNVIIGTSDSGKTSIIRALRWLIWNRPGGDAFRSTWGGKTLVTLTTDGKYIARGKGDDNIYVLEDSIFNAFGTDVPKEIKQVLNLNEINLQSQLDSPFLLSSTPGEVASHFNRIAHLDQIDSGLKTIQGWIRGIEQDIRSGESQVNQSKEELKKFDHLEKFEIDIEVLEDMQGRFLQQVNNVRELKTTIENININQDDIKGHSKILKLEPLLNIILGWITERKYTKESLDKLGAEIEELKDLNTDIEDYQHVASAEKPVNALLLMFVKKAKLNDLYNSMQKSIDSITNNEYYLVAEVKGLKQSEKEFEDNFPELCPLCGKPYKKK